MSNVATTRMSSKGQIVIPEEIRKALHLKTGTRFVVLGEGDVVVLKTITPPSVDEFDEIIMRARREASKAGIEQKDLQDIIREVRSEKCES
ncbi:MAG: AbrB/MazE/SpoVT family DNA-binding domain-containing protein [Candidatus Aegiribacteria sp.]|nr:AbrB/MazE/SpoVT family DNA-binding domain-containing protein [Candidatus Aegiribacteria sp.]